MARPATIPEVHRKRGNPNWGRFIPPAPVLSTEFELQVRRLHSLQRPMSFHSSYADGASNRNRFYIPEWLLEDWSITVDPYVIGAA
jgi:hypothetical protein